MAFIPIVRYFNPTLEISVAGTSARFFNAKGLQMSFRVTRTSTPSADTAEVAIAGLDPIKANLMGATFATLGKAKLRIRAGYDLVLLGLFNGDVRTFSSNEQVGADGIMRCVADDGGDAVTDERLPQALSSTVGLTAGQMIAVAIATMKLIPHPSVAEIVSTSDPSVQGPFTAVHVGRASQLLDAACRRIGARWWTRDGQVLLGRRGIVDKSRPAVVITDKTLVRAPTLSGNGLTSLETMFDPNIVPGSQVFFKGAHLKVESSTATGDTRGSGIWTTKLTGRAIWL